MTSLVLKILFDPNSHKFAMTQNVRKRCCWRSYIWEDWFTFYKSHNYYKWHAGVYEGKLDVNIKIQLKQCKIFKFSLWTESLFMGIWNFIVRKLSLLIIQESWYGVHLRTKIIENKIQFEVQKLDYPCRNLVIWIWNRNERSRNSVIRTWSYFEQENSTSRMLKFKSTFQLKCKLHDLNFNSIYIFEFEKPKFQFERKRK